MPEVRLGIPRWSRPRCCRGWWAPGAPPGWCSPASRSTRITALDMGAGAGSLHPAGRSTKQSERSLLRTRWRARSRAAAPLRRDLARQRGVSCRRGAAPRQVAAASLGAPGCGCRRTTISSRSEARSKATRYMAKQQVYDASAIQALKGLEPVRRMPGMYTHTVHPLHIVQEAIDNAVDEALAGFGKSITVSVFKDGSVAGRGRGPRHPGRHAPGGEEAGGRGRLHHAARRRQVLALGRRRVPHLRRPARRRRGGVQRAVEALRSHGLSGTAKSTSSPSRAASSRAS